MYGRSGQAKTPEEGLMAGLRAGAVSVPMLLLTTYAKLDLSEEEAMLLIQLIGFRDREMKEFPTMDDLRSRMSLSGEKVADTLRKLMKEGFLAIDEDEDPMTGIRYERYNLDGLWQKLGAVWAMESKLQGTASREPAKAGVEPNLYSLFEKEFARPLTPMEMETITGWLDQDRYPDELILMALKEAVFAGKIHFRYIDRILLEWKRNKVYTPEQAKEHTQRFRGSLRG
ncbi:DnaD domain-containing protein [Gorillibacterium sp. sgz5001074]|uniref:DnaD domain-containing protein n=1 Tax=Gorillibacterium sp. sgz5001074 TaxID=3446695 RepID=UPI003F67E05D